MNISDTQVLAAGGWVAATFASSIIYLFKMNVTLTKRIGRLESKIESQEEDLKEYRACTIPICPFKFKHPIVQQPKVVTFTQPTTS